MASNRYGQSLAHDFDTKGRSRIQQIDQHLLTKSNKEYKCICEMCSCGKHKCPRPHIKGQFQTSYNSQFKQIHHKVAATKPPEHVIKERHYNPEALRTRYKETFQEPHPYQNQELNRSRLENIGKSIVRPHIPFASTSAYKEQFKPFSLEHPVNPEDPYLDRRDKIPDYNFQSPAKFDDHTAYKEQFAPPSPIKVGNYPHPQYKKPEVPFYGSSSYKDQFKQVKMLQPKYESYSQSLSQSPRVKFDDHTSYKDQYKGYKMEIPAGTSGKGCILDGTNVPQHNFLNSHPHMYYDEKTNKFS